MIARNRRASHDYFLEERLEAGLVLQGTEVKSLREGRANINEAYASEQGGELYLINATIPSTAPATSSITSRSARASCCCTGARWAS